MEKYIYEIFYDVSSNIEYVCRALPGIQEYDDKWQIFKLFYVSGNITELKYADGTSNFNKIVGNREYYQYLGRLKTLITATENISVFTTFDLTASGASYTKSGDDGWLGYTETIFKSSDHIKVLYKSKELSKENQAFWISSTTLQINQPLLKNQAFVIEG